jgi:para-aminobenzoate synthetase/4-amino-4-deoxychorismate lyase
VFFGLCDGPADVPPVAVRPGTARDYSVGAWQRGWSEAGYRDDVARVRECIAAGETYQLNLTVRLRAELTGDLEQLYADLAWAQRGSYAAYLDLGRHVVVSASPELFVEWTPDRLLTRPMKGTAPRGCSRPDRSPARPSSRLNRPSPHWRPRPVVPTPEASVWSVRWPAPT